MNIRPGATAQSGRARGCRVRAEAGHRPRAPGRALHRGVKPRLLLADSGYRNEVEFREELTHYRDGDSKPIAAQKPSADLPPTAWKSVSWGDGAKGRKRWLLCAWTKNEKQPTKFHLSTRPAHISLKQLVRLTKLR